MTYKRDQTNAEFNALLRRIECADDFEINQIIAAVNKRFQIQFPDWEVLYISCPKNDPAERKRIMQHILDFFDRNT